MPGRSTRTHAALAHAWALLQRAAEAEDPGGTGSLQWTITDEQERRFAALVEALGLGELERVLLGLASLPALTPGAAQLLGTLGGRAGPGPSPLLLARFAEHDGHAPETALAALGADARLRHRGALEAVPGATPEGTVLVASARALNAVLGADVHPAAATAGVDVLEVPRLPVGRDVALGALAAALALPAPSTPCAVRGRDGAYAVAAASERGALCADATLLLDTPFARDLMLWAALAARPIALRELAAVPADRRGDLLRVVRGAPVPVVLLLLTGADALAVADVTVRTIELPGPMPAERRRMWEAACGEPEIAAAMASHRFGPAEIDEICSIAESMCPPGVPLHLKTVQAAARAVTDHGITELADRLPLGPTWDDIVLMPRSRSGLEAVGAYLRNRDAVRRTPGYERMFAGRGLTALFAGESGTGKTLAARVLAASVGLDVFRVDLSGLYSRWLGEMEKNLDRVFSAADDIDAVLFFDEADVVFGRRGEASDAQGRYGNLSTAYLLQRIEAFDGVVVLATNFAQNIDPAFLRRVDVFVDFPEPDEATRGRLWSSMLAAAGVDINGLDLPFLTARFQIAGGAIRNATISALVFAADADRTMTMDDLLRAIALEYRKLGRLVLASDFGPYYDTVREYVG
ncbi:ATP-binding protein [Paraconexibacter algicola]|uniref:AAA+ ATPase domain-containing protein n=1 Tax=Paraconexibacter algicola TaxID=2133960 RepID=A0A2T4UIS8_9ACTN|nr:ATP-binding protein [Paraconexibacter algicola]PTL59154.1 hypothetical protein C7Y72_05580 [Paraconexibacter algicola]